MSYLSQPTSTLDYGVVKIGNYIEVVDGVVSGQQNLASNASPTFANVSVSGDLTANGKSVVTSVTANAGNGISISNLIANGYAASFTVNNTGVLRLEAGPGIYLSSNTGNIIVSATGADLMHVYGTTTNYTLTLDDEYVGVSSATNVTMTLPSGTIPEGRVYIIKDEYGQGSGKITIQPSSGTLIDGKTNYIVSIPNQSVQIIYRAGGWWII